MLYGWDISNHDWDRHAVDLADAKRAGISFVTHKATEGNWYRDPYLGRFAAQVKSVGFPVAGTYHVLNHGIDVAEQVDYWVSYVTQNVPWWQSHPCWIWQLDCEPMDGYETPSMAEIVACGKRLETRYGIDADRIIAYAPKWVYGQSLTGLPYKLWASGYGVNNAHEFHTAFASNGPSWDFYSGQTPAVLQFGSRTQIGRQPECDANAVRVDTVAQLQALFGVRPRVDINLLEWIMALPGAPKNLTYDQFLADLAHALWAYDQDGAKRQAWGLLQDAANSADVAAAVAAKLKAGA